MADGGYDISDYRDIHPDFGTLEQADRFVAMAHELGLRVLIDLVPNHSSDQHPWFQAALAAGKGSPERELYVFRDGLGEEGDIPPNNWPAMFGGRAWERTTEADGRPGQWYLHLFAPEQPDWNWDNPAVADEFDAILRFWFDRGVDGFRIDVANSMVTAPGLPDLDVDPTTGDPVAAVLTGTPYLNQPGIHDIFRRWRSVADSYADTPQGSRIFVSEAYVTPATELARYVRPDELHTTFNFDALLCEWTASSQRSVIDLTLAATAEVGAPLDLGAGQPRHHPRGDSVRTAAHRGPLHPGRDRHRRHDRLLVGHTELDGCGPGPPAGARGGAAGAGPAGWGVRLPGRRARSGGGRGPAGRRPAGPDLGPLRSHPARPRLAAGCRSPGPAPSRRSASDRRIARPGCPNPRTV